ncbi:MAG: site-specific DNA-methyltransferase [Chloroflexi bacterium]|nr:MAG: site-specific DNA-methyltransferase [Chloroflexota bacterium]
MAELVWKGKHVLPTHRQTATSGSYQLLTKHYYTAQQAATDTSPAQLTQWYNRLIWGDKNIILPALLPTLRFSVDLIYIDPPFMTGRTFTTGEQLAYHDTWHNNLDSYLQWLYDTLVLLHQLLAETGSLYIHLDWRTSHYVKVMLDEIFGSSSRHEGAGFKNEIIWHYQSGGRFQKYYARKHDTILLYSKSAQYCFHRERVGERRGPSKRNHMRKEVTSDGSVTWTIRSGGKVYAYNEDSLITPSDVWSDISHLHQRDPERTGYATQKPEALLERIILASSEENGLVLDCFCGSGVTPAVAERLGRRWIACDKSELAIDMTSQRLLKGVQHCPFALQQAVFTEQEAHPLI